MAARRLGPCLGVSLGACLTAGALAAAPLLEIRGSGGVIVAEAADILGVALTSDLGGYPAVTVRLRPNFTSKFAALTSAHVGETLTFLVCGQVVVEPVIHGEIRQPHFSVTGEGGLLASGFLPHLRGEEPCPAEE